MARRSRSSSSYLPLLYLLPLQSHPSPHTPHLTHSTAYWGTTSPSTRCRAPSSTAPTPRDTAHTALGSRLWLGFLFCCNECQSSPVVFYYISHLLTVLRVVVLHSSLDTKCRGRLNGNTNIPSNILTAVGKSLTRRAALKAAVMTEVEGTRS